MVAPVVSPSPDFGCESRRSVGLGLRENPDLPPKKTWLESVKKPESVV